MTSPTLPRSRSNPIGGTQRIRAAMKPVKRQLRRTQRWLLDEVDAIPREPITVNQQRYDYLISVQQLAELVRRIVAQIDAVPSDSVVAQVLAAYEQATGTAVVNLARLTNEYTRDIVTVVTSEPYRRRTALIGARVFEEMAGFKAETATDLARVLMQAIEDGEPTRQIKQRLSQRFHVSVGRAERIARTEIGMSSRRATWDETEDAEVRLGIRTGLLWISALSPTTRKTHADKHGDIVNQDQVREFYARDGNGINCKCAQVPVMLDADGKPTTPGVVERVRAYPRQE